MIGRAQHRCSERGRAVVFAFRVLPTVIFIGALMSVPNESDCRFMEAPPPVPPLRIFALTNRPGRPKKGTVAPSRVEEL